MEEINRWNDLRRELEELGQAQANAAELARFELVTRYELEKIVALSRSIELTFAKLQAGL